MRKRPVTSDGGQKVMRMTGNAPVKKISAGQVSAALWENEININGQSKTVLKATVQRRYKDKTGEWKSTQSFSRTELPLAIHCLQKAFETMLEVDRDRLDVVEECVEG